MALPAGNFLITPLLLSIPEQSGPPTEEPAFVSNPLQSTPIEPLRRPTAYPNRVSEQKIKSPLDPHSFPATTPKSFYVSKTIRTPQFARSRGSFRISSLPASSQQQLPPAGSVHERSAERPGISGGRTTIRPIISQQQRYQAHGYGSALQQTRTPMSQFPEAFYENLQTYGAPINNHHAHTHLHGRSSTQNHFVYPALPPGVPSQWNSSGSTPLQEKCYGVGPATFPQSMQACQPRVCTVPVRGTYLDHPPIGPISNGSGWIRQSASSVASGSGPNAAPMAESVSSPAGYRAASSGPFPVSVATFPDSNPGRTLLFPEEGPTRCLSGPSATDIGTNSLHLIQPISSDDLVYPGRSQPDGPWGSSEGMSLPLFQPEEPRKGPILNPASHLSPFTLSHPNPAEVVPPGDSYFQVPPPLARANLVTSGPSPGTGGNANNNPTPANQPIGLHRGNRTSPRQSAKPYERPTPSTSHKTRPIPYEGNLMRLQQRCREQGADEIAVGFLPQIFTNGQVSLEALIRPFTDAEVEAGESGGRTGKVYTAFLSYTQEEEEEGGIPRPRHICRLCHSSQTWKHSKDVLRHLKRDHFGLSTICKKCDRKFYTNGEMTRHPCKSV